MVPDPTGRSMTQRAPFTSTSSRLLTACRDGTSFRQRDPESHVSGLPQSTDGLGGEHALVRLLDDLVFAQRSDYVLALTPRMPCHHEEVVRLQRHVLPVAQQNLNGPAAIVVGALAQERHWLRIGKTAINHIVQPFVPVATASDSPPDEFPRHDERMPRPKRRKRRPSCVLPRDHTGTTRGVHLGAGTSGRTPWLSQTRIHSGLLRFRAGKRQGAGSTPAGYSEITAPSTRIRRASSAWLRG
jgi:hypothetical protein